LAAELLPDMNTTVDPCVDFYAYACDGWEASNPLPDSKSRLTRFDVLHNENRVRMNAILQDNQSITGSPTQSPEETAADARNIDKMRTVYHACNNDDLIDSRHTEPVRGILGIAREPFGGLSR
jgi:predicted metalloendopeptidase